MRKMAYLPDANIITALIRDACGPMLARLHEK